MQEMPNCGSTEINSKYFCSGIWGPYELLIVDTLKIPHKLEPGEYVFGRSLHGDGIVKNQLKCGQVVLI